MDAQGSRTRRRLALLSSSVFTVAFAAMLAAQLSLMSVLDTDRAEQVADDVASSAFVTGLVDDAVRNAVSPIAGPEVARQVGLTASTDPRVRDVVRASLVGAHRQVVDPSAPRGPDASDVNTVVADVLGELGAASGVDLAGLAPQLEVPSARPAQLPDVGLRSMATLTRAIAAVVAVVAAVVTIVVHPRPALGLAGLGARATVVCGVWTVAMLVIGWVIGQVADTLFGELLQAVWSNAAPTMLAVVVGGLLVASGVWLGGRAIDGLAGSRSRV